MQKRENQKTILGYEDAYLKLKSVTHVSDIKVNYYNVDLSEIELHNNKEIVKGLDT